MAGHHGKGEKMAKRKKQDKLTYTHHINLRLTDIQYDFISEAAAQAGLTLSEYIRRQLMDGKVIAKYEIVADVPEIKRITAELGKIGSNLNQIARYFNSGGNHSQTVHNAIDQSIADLHVMKHAVLKMAGNFFAADRQHI